MRFLLLFLTIITISFAKSEFKSVSFDIKDIQGNSYHVTTTPGGLNIPSLKGKVVYLAFFGHRCPPCLKEIPEFIKFSSDKEFSKKAVILAFEVQGLDENLLKQFAKNQGINYRLVAGSKYRNFVDFVGFATKWNWGIPYMVILDQEGKVVYYDNGIFHDYVLRKITNKLFEKTDKKVAKQTKSKEKK